MGLFDWVSGRRDKQPDADFLKLLGPEARRHHYLFAHKMFPAHVWNGDSVLGILANPENQEYTVNLWNDLGGQLEPKDRIPAKGMRHSSHWIGGGHLIVLVELPAAQISPEAHFIAITTSPLIRYLTLEKSTRMDGSGTFVLAEWRADGTHSNFGVECEPTVTAFLHSVCRMLSLPETVEPPTRQQLQGMAKGRMNVDLTMPSALPEAEEHKVREWEQEAEAAFEEDDLPRAEQLHRQILDLRMSRQGPENTIATLTHGGLAQMLTFQGRHHEAEEVCRTWWKHCRRDRMLGHAETMSATRMLAECLHWQGKEHEAAELMGYRALLAGLSRGADSMIASNARSELEIFQQTIGRAKPSKPDGTGRASSQGG